MCVVAPILNLATALPDWADNAGWILLVIAAAGIIFVVLSQPSRKQGLTAVASDLGLEYIPALSADEMGTRGASFVYMDSSPARHCLRGMIKGRETVIFDQYMPIDPVSGRPDGPVEGTVIGFHVAADSFCRDRGVVQRTFWHVEKMGEWVFVYHDRGVVTPADIPSYVEEARARFETATNPKGYTPVSAP